MQIIVFLIWSRNKMSHHREKPTICIGENKGADQLRSNCEADQHLYFRYSDSTNPLLLSYFNPKFQDSSSFLLLHRPVCVGSGRKPHCWFSHEAAQMSFPESQVYMTSVQNPLAYQGLYDHTSSYQRWVFN